MLPSDPTWSHGVRPSACREKESDVVLVDGDADETPLAIRELLSAHAARQAKLHRRFVAVLSVVAERI